MLRPETAKDLMFIIDDWLMSDDPCSWGAFETDLYNILWQYGYYKEEDVGFTDD